MAWALHRTEKEKPAAGKTDYWRNFWRSGWDSNPRNLAVQLISSQSRYDHFDTAPYDYASLGYFYTGRKKEALIMAEKAVEKEPQNERLIANRDIIAQLSETL